MLLRFFNREDEQLQERSDQTYEIDSLDFKRRDTAQIDISPIRSDGTPFEWDPVPGSPLTSFIFGCKLPGKLSGDFCVSNNNGTPGVYAYSKSNGSRVNDGSTASASAAVASASAVFNPTDKGLAISGAGIPAGTTILAVVSATTITLSANATATTTGVALTISGRQPVYTVTPTINSVELSDAFVDGTIAQTVASQAARYALTGLALGTILKQYDSTTPGTPPSYWQVTDTAHLADAAGWQAAPEKTNVVLTGEIEVLNAGVRESSHFFTVNVENDVIRNNEGAGSSANPSYPAPGLIALKSELANRTRDFLATPWSEAVNGDSFLFEGPYTFSQSVISARSNITVANIGTGTLQIADGGGTNSISIAPGETVTFSTVAATGGAFTFTQVARRGIASTVAPGIAELATDAETQAGTDTGRVVPVSALAAWWAWVKTQAQTIAGAWTFGGRVQGTAQPGQNGVSGTAATTDLLTSGGADARFGGQVYSSILSADTSFTGTSFVDTPLTLTLPAGKYEMLGLVAGVSASSTAGVNISLTTNNTADPGLATTIEYTQNGAPILSRNHIMDYGAVNLIAGATSASANSVRWYASRAVIILAASRTITVQVAQRDASDTSNPWVLKKGSSLIFRRLP